jgi:hypothetical protein
MNETRYSVEQAKKLFGGKIVEVFTDTNEEYWGFKVKVRKQTYMVWVDRDTEGNGPGHLKVEKDNA